MNEGSYKSVLSKATFGYAYYRAIIDDEGKPVDYEFLEVNTAFENLSGLKACEIIGKLVGEVMPGIKDTKFDLLTHYDAIALHGGEIEFEQFFEPLDKWYKVQVSSTEKGYITTLVSDITIQFKLAVVSQTFLSYTSESVNNQYIIDTACEIAGASYAAFNIFDESDSQFTTVAFSGLNADLILAAQKLDLHFPGQKWKQTQLLEETFKDKKTTILNRLGQLTETVIAPEIIENIVHMFDVGQVAVVKITKQDRLLGNLTLIFSKGKQLQNQPLLETYADMTGMLLDRFNQEDSIARERKVLEEDSIRKNNFQKLLMEIASGFINIPLENVDMAIQQALEDLGKFVYADRSYIFNYDWEKDVCNNSYEWCADGITAEIENLQLVPLSMMQDWVVAHQKGESMYISDVFQLPEGNVRELLEPQGVKSLLAVPMLINGNCIGFVGFDSVKHHHIYSSADQQLLYVFAQVLANVKIRKEMIDNLLVAMQKIEESERKLKESQTIAKLGSWELDITNGVFTLNDNFYTLFQTNASEMGGYEMTVQEYSGRFLFAEDVSIVAEEMGKATQATNADFSNYLEHRIKYNDGRTGYVAVKHYVVKDKNGKAIKTYGVIQDITERKLLELDLIVAKEKAEESSRLKTAFINNISHEIRTPLNGILGFGGLMMNERFSQEQKLEFYTILQQSTNRLLQTMTDIMDNSELIAKTILPKIADVHIATLINNQIHKFTTKCLQKNIILLAQLPAEHEDIIIQTDEELITKILTQLVSNAEKFTTAGTILLGFDLYDNWVRFFVQDTGKGIATDKLELIFQPFFQEDVSNTRGHEGNGLGLSIAKGMVELLGGEMKVKSQPGLGSTFFFTIPLLKMELKA